MTEEGAYRGLLQPSLVALAGGTVAAGVGGIAAAAVLFGLEHYRGGSTYVALSTLAGIGYGAAAFASGRGGGAIAVHLALNTVHFVGFTYPARDPRYRSEVHGVASRIASFEGRDEKGRAAPGG